MFRSPSAGIWAHDCSVTTTQHDQRSPEYELLVDQIQAMLHQEETGYACCANYTTQRRQSTDENAGIISESWRQKICEWGFEVVDHFDYSREVVSKTMSFLDRYVSSSVKKGSFISRKEFQLAAVACLYIAIKMEGNQRAFDRRSPLLTISTLVNLGRGIFSAKAIKGMEQKILSSLGWRMNPPTSFHFISLFTELFLAYNGCDGLHKNVRNDIIEAARYLSELSICVSSLAIECKPSIIALASLHNALDFANSENKKWDSYTFFIGKIHQITNIHPESDQLQEVRASLKKMCPSIHSVECDILAEGKQNEEDSRSSVTGSASPVCVSGQKRSFDSTSL